MNRRRQPGGRNPTEPTGTITIKSVEQPSKHKTQDRSDVGTTTPRITTDHRESHNRIVAGPLAVRKKSNETTARGAEVEVFIYFFLGFSWMMNPTS